MSMVKTSELAGAALDWAVAAADEAQFRERRIVKVCRVEATTPAWIALENGIGECMYHRFSPSTDWAQGGPIIERECIGLLFDSGSICRKPCWFATPDDQSTSRGYESEVFDGSIFMVDECAGMYGPTTLIAAMRCYVASKLGDEVDVPVGLCK